jgi:hypothetical protein
MVMTTRSGSTTSRNSPAKCSSIWSGPWNMTALHAPPGRGSIDTRSRGIDEPCSPNQAANRSATVHALKTSSRGASTTRTISIPSASLCAET